MRPQLITAIGSGASLLASVAVPIAFPHIDPLIGKYLLVAALALFALTVGLWWPRRHQEHGGFTQSTAGPGAHNISAARDVHIHPSPAAIQERKQYSDQGGSKRGYARLEVMRKCPPMRIAEALAHLLSLGRSREDARLELQQAFRDNRIVVWGRAEITPPHMSAPFRAQETWQIVPPLYWTEFRLTDEAFSPDERGPQTEAQDHIRKRLLRRYWSMRVHPGQVHEEWPQPTTPGRPPDLGPNGWMAG